MVFNILQDIRQIFHGLGEKKPRMDTVKEIQSVLLKQMTLLIFKTHQIAMTEHSSQITVKHIVYALRYHKLTLIRMLIYYLLKDSFQKLTAMNQSITAVDEAKSISKENKSFDQDLVVCVANTNSNEQYKDPITFLKSLNFKSRIFTTRKNYSLFWQICEAITELKLELKITQEDIDNSTLERNNRVNKLSVEVSMKGYESFQICRTKNFQHRLGTLLLSEVGQALPVNIIYTKEAKELFKFLAKETIACLFDHVCRNQKLEKQNSMNDVQKSVYLNKKFSEYTCPDEIAAVTNAIWDPALGDICVPFKENNTFFFNPLIFD